MIRIQSLEIENFLSIAQASLSFTDGLYLITGYDKTNNDSNGAGKSTILSAICWAIFGKTIKGLGDYEVVNWDSTISGCKCAIVLSNGEDEYKIVRRPGMVSLHINGEIQPGTKNIIQKQIESTFHTNYYSFIRTVAFSQGKAEFLGNMTDSDRKKLLKSILEMGVLDILYQLSGNRIKEIQKAEEAIKDRMPYLLSDLNKLTKESEDNATRLARLQAAAETDDTQLEKMVQSVRQSWRNTIQSIKEKTKMYRALVTEYTRLNAKALPPLHRDHLMKDLSELQTILKQTEEKIWIMKAEVENLKRSQADTPLICVLCGQEVSLETLQEKVRKSEKELERVVKPHQQLVKQYEEMSIKYRDEVLLTEEINKVGSEMAHYGSDLNGLKLLVLMQYKQYMTAKQTQVGQLSKVQQEIKMEEKRKKEIERMLQNTTSHIEKLEDNLEEITSKLAIYQYLQWVFSRQGVIMRIIEQVLQRIQVAANSYLRESTNERLKILVLSVRELKTKTLTDEMDIVIERNKKKIPFWALSDGQRQRINIALLLALNEVCRELGFNRFDFLLLDEVLDLSLDKKGQEDIGNILKSLKSRISTTFIISHSNVLAGEFQKHLHVTRDERGISTVKEEA